MKHHHSIEAGIMLVLLLPASARAIVNVEQAIIGKPSEGVHTSLDLQAGGAGGNSDTNSTSADFLGLWQHGAQTEYLQAQYARGQSNGQTVTDNAFLHLRHRTQIEPAWAIEEFAQTGRNRFARLVQRTLLGGGLRLTLFEEEQKSAGYLGMGAFCEWETLNYVFGTTDPLRTRLWRANTYMIWKRQLSDQLRFSNTIYYQPAFSNVADYRALEQAALRIALHEHLDLKVSLNITYDSRPPQTVRKRDMVYGTGLEFNF